MLCTNFSVHILLIPFPCTLSVPHSPTTLSVFSLSAVAFTSPTICPPPLSKLPNGHSTSPRYSFFFFTLINFSLSSVLHPSCHLYYSKSFTSPVICSFLSPFSPSTQVSVTPHISVESIISLEKPICRIASEQCQCTINQGFS